jgi:serine/threonine protein kinase
MRNIGELLNGGKEEEPLPAIELRPTNDLPRPRAIRFSLPSGARPLDGYTIRRGVGIGGFGEVYYATSDAGKEVALKKIQRNLDIEVRGVTQCLNLKHPNLVALYDIRHDGDDQAWVVMEYVSGDNLQQTLEKSPNGLPQEELHRWWDGITAGVAYLHDCGIVHRDLKPGNIFRDHGIVKIGDYGLSKFISCSRRSGQTQSVGTFHYMAPEIGQGRYGKEIDVYALGIMLYEMITGKVPFDGESSQEIIMKHLTAEPSLDGVPAPYREVIRRALAKDPTKRFSNVHEMRTFLPGYSPLTAPVAVAGLGPTTIPVSPSQPKSDDAGDTLFHPEDSANSPSIAAFSLPDEPVARAITATVRDLRSTWDGLSPNTRRILLLITIIVLAANARSLGNYLGVLVAAYVIYLTARAFFGPKPGLKKISRMKTFPKQLAGKQQVRPSVIRAVAAARAAAEAAPVSQPSKVVPIAKQGSVQRGSTGKQLEERVRLTLANKSTQTRSTELFMSMLASAFIVPVLSFLATLFLLYTEQSRPLELFPNFLLLTLVGTMFTWSILAVGKLWESREADDSLRRFIMLLVGLAGGSATYGLVHLIGANPPTLLAEEVVRIGSFHGAHGEALFPAYLAHYSGLFSILRWWRQADPLRRMRLSVAGTVGTILVAFILQNICPVPAGFIIAGIVAIAVQLASNWVPRSQWASLQDQTQLVA